MIRGVEVLEKEDRNSSIGRLQGTKRISSRATRFQRLPQPQTAVSQWMRRKGLKETIRDLLPIRTPLHCPAPYSIIATCFPIPSFLTESPLLQHHHTPNSSTIHECTFRSRRYRSAGLVLVFDFAFVHAADSVNQRLVYDEGVTLSLDSGRIIIDSRFQDGL